MKALIFAAVGVMLLSPTFCQSGMGNDADNLAGPTMTIKTFRGAPSNSFEVIPVSAIEGWTGATTVKIKCPEESGSNLLVNNATMGYLSSSLSTKFIPAIYILVFAVGVPANAVTLWKLFFGTRSICMTIFNINLATADLLFCATLPFKIAYHLNGNNWVFGEVMCRATTVIFYGNMYCSILIIACISISRYLAVVHPFTYRRLPKRTYASITCGLVWAMVFLYMLPLFILKQEYYLVHRDITTCHDVYNTCESSSPFQLYYFISLAFFGFLIPFVVIIYCYTAIIRTLNAYDQRWLWYVKMSLLILVIFTICFAPSNIILIIHNANHYYNTDGLYFIYLIALCLGSLNSCLDPFLYFLMSKVTDHSKAYITIVRSL
ncbi:proteinase-activated receptor 3 [Molossus molossus]|uniref:Coagulation factor II thrombin receptor like 2 n=1 Tax=Molossus molossus TaxID=27622 RepID=A0A7J8IXI6_MOLMO|nr:proteinase-activated receptor 3 [Molossus molossus]KAF6489366.1 coagulation factor II thrombin receptor like 2 [Molossus molossus]